MDPNDLKKPVYNSSLKLIKQIDDLKSTKKDDDVSINESAIERINEKVSVKLNLHDQLYSGLAPVAPQDEDFNQFMRILEAEKKLKPKVKPSTNLIKNTLKPPDLMEFYPDDLVKEFPEVEIETVVKPTGKFRPARASMSLVNSATENFYKWN